MTRNYYSILKPGSLRKYNNIKSMDYVLRLEELSINEVVNYTNKLVERYGDDGLFSVNEVVNAQEKLKDNNISLKEKESSLEEIAEAFSNVDNLLDPLSFQSFRNNLDF